MTKEEREFVARLTYAMKLIDIGNNELERRAGMVNAKTGKTSGHISRLLLGERPIPGWPIAKAIADALGVRAAWLLAGEEPRELQRPAPPQQPVQLPSLPRRQRKDAWPLWASVETEAFSDADISRRKKDPKNNVNVGAAILYLARELTSEPQPPDFDKSWLRKRAEKLLDGHDLYNRLPGWKDLLDESDKRWAKHATPRAKSIVSRRMRAAKSVTKTRTS